MSLVSELHINVSKNPWYQDAERKLLLCEAGLSVPGDALQSFVPGAASVLNYDSFDDLLGDYTPETRKRLKQNCEKELTALFNMLHSVSKSELKILKNKPDNIAYRNLLNSPHGKVFEEHVGHPSITELYAIMLADASPEPSDGVSARKDSVKKGSVKKDTVNREGINCLMEGEDAPTTVEGKLEVLNCLSFETDQDFWREQAKKDETTHFIESNDRYQFLGDGDWECSNSPDPVILVCVD